MVRGGFCRQQLIPTHFTDRILLPHSGLFRIGEPGWHWPCRHEYRRQVTETQYRDQQTGDNFVADSETGDSIKHQVREGYRSRLGDIVAAE